MNRVTVYKMIDDNPKHFNPELFYSHILNFNEVRMVNDCCISDITIVDVSNVKITHVMKTPIMLLQKVQAIFEVSISN